MNTGINHKRLKRRLKKKLYRFLVALNDFDFGRLRPACYLLLIAGILLAWAKLPTKEFTNAADAQIAAGAKLSGSIRTSVNEASGHPVDVVALFLSQETTPQETLYSFYLTGKELSYLAEGAITAVTQEHNLYLDGLNFTYHKNRLPFNRVTALTTASGTELAATTLYHVVSTEDIFALFHYISYRSIGIMNVYPKDAAGALLSDYQKVILTEAGAPLTVYNTASAARTANAVPSLVTTQRGFNLINLIKEPNRITICVIALFIALLALIWYIVPRMNRIRVWFRIYRIRSKKRSSHTLYGLRKRL
jgi:hypothetical protein